MGVRKGYRRAWIVTEANHQGDHRGGLVWNGKTGYYPCNGCIPAADLFWNRKDAEAVRDYLRWWYPTVSRDPWWTELAKSVQIVVIYIPHDTGRDTNIRALIEHRKEEHL